MIDDDARRSLYARLSEVLGDEHATTLMHALPSPAADLATRSDLEALVDRLEGNLGARMDRLEERMDRFEVRLGIFDDRLHGFHDALRRQVIQLVLAQGPVLLALAVLAFAAARLT